MIILRGLGVILPFLVVTNCAEVPDLEASVPDWVADAPYPDLISVDNAVTSLPPPEAVNAEITEDIATRAARLRDKARQLQTPVVDEAARGRMAEGVPL